MLVYCACGQHNNLADYEAASSREIVMGLFFNGRLGDG